MSDWPTNGCPACNGVEGDCARCGGTGYLPGSEPAATAGSALFSTDGRGAEISPCGRYRYLLWRCWDESKPVVLFMMLNPSTADANVDDPTIRRCIGFARRWGYGTLLVWNLYAYRATDPRELDEVDAPIGGENEDHLWRILQAAQPPALIVAAWGAKPNRGQYVNREKTMFWGPFWEREVYALGVTKDGHPRHPLYVRADADLIPFGRSIRARWNTAGHGIEESYEGAAPAAEPADGERPRALPALQELRR